MPLLLIKYGLAAVFVGALLEADVVPVLAGVAAHRGYLDPPLRCSRSCSFAAKVWAKTCEDLGSTPKRRC